EVVAGDDHAGPPRVRPAAVQPGVPPRLARDGQRGPDGVGGATRRAGRQAGRGERRVERAVPPGGPVRHRVPGAARGDGAPADAGGLGRPRHVGAERRQRAQRGGDDPVAGRGHRCRSSRPTRSPTGMAWRNSVMGTYTSRSSITLVTTSLRSTLLSPSSARVRSGTMSAGRRSGRIATAWRRIAASTAPSAGPVPVAGRVPVAGPVAVAVEGAVRVLSVRSM